MKQEVYRRIVSGGSKGPAAAAARVLLRGLSLPYGAVVRVRNKLYDWNLLRCRRADAAVISVGNLTAGGTGKTPLVIWLARYLAQRGCSCAVLTRGYKTTAGTLSDEPALLARACEAAVIVNSDRLAGAKKAVEQHRANVLILDDGFQHRRIRRDVNILTIDATCPFGYGRLLPAGLLREPVSSLRRAHAVVLTRCDLASEEDLAAIEMRIRTIHPDAAIFRSVHRSMYAKTFGNETIDMAALQTKKLFAFCGIGNPDAFLGGLTRMGLSVVASRSFDDHHAYTEADMLELTEQAAAYGAELLLSTEKDWVKAALLYPRQAKVPLACMGIELDFLQPPDTITRMIDEAVRPFCTSRTEEVSSCSPCEGGGGNDKSESAADDKE